VAGSKARALSGVNLAVDGLASTSLATTAHPFCYTHLPRYAFSHFIATAATRKPLQQHLFLLRCLAPILRGERVCAQACVAAALHRLKHRAYYHAHARRHTPYVAWLIAAGGAA